MRDAGQAFYCIGSEDLLLGVGFFFFPDRGNVLTASRPSTVIYSAPFKLPG